MKHIDGNLNIPLTLRAYPLAALLHVYALHVVALSHQVKVHDDYDRDLHALWIFAHPYHQNGA